MKKSKKTILAFGLGLGAGALAASCGVTSAATSLAVNRKLPAFARHMNASGTGKDPELCQREMLAFWESYDR